MPRNFLSIFSAFVFVFFLLAFDAQAACAAMSQVNSDLQSFTSELKPVLWTLAGIFSLFVAWKFITKDDSARHYLMAFLLGLVLLKYGGDIVTGFGGR